MGYRSQVAIVIKTADNDKFLEAINAWDLDKKLHECNSARYFLKHADVDKESKDGKYRLISWDSVKWYSGIEEFKDVEFFENIDNYDIEYDFVRIGEEMGDYEVKGVLGSGLICPNQNIWFNNECI